MGIFTKWAASDFVLRIKIEKTQLTQLTKVVHLGYVQYWSIYFKMRWLFNTSFSPC